MPFSLIRETEVSAFKRAILVQFSTLLLKWKTYDNYLVTFFAMQCEPSIMSDVNRLNLNNVMKPYFNQKNLLFKSGKFTSTTPRFIAN